MIDYRTLLADVRVQLGDAPFTDRLGTAWADTLLATRVPLHCPVCKGTMPKHNAFGPYCSHESAPTIAARLALADRADELIAVIDLALAQVRAGEIFDATALAVIRHALAALRTKADQ